jgi:hypothetical protein
MRNQQTIAPWALAESAGADCGDARLTKRLGILLSAMGNAPSASIPCACAGGHAEIAAAYRFFDHADTTPERLLAPHFEQTRQRMKQYDTVLLVQDTTEHDMTQPQRRVSGAGPLDGSQRQGAFLHLLHAYSAQGISLGSLWQRIIVRPEDVRSGRKKAKTRSQYRAQAIAQKESHRWIEGMEQAHSVARSHPAQRIICIADSEADIYEYLASAQQAQSAAQEEPRARWIVRACQDRLLRTTQTEQTPSDQTTAKLWEHSREQPVIVEQTLHVRGRPAPKVTCDKRQRRQPREDREIRIAVRAASVTIQAPQRRGGKGPDLKVNVVLVSEINAPEGDVPVEWLLLSNLPIDSEAAVREIIEAYRKRFLIEVFFRVLKSGCRIEAKRFEQCDRHLSLLALAIIIAWRVQSLTQAAQHEPEASASKHFEASEWQAAWAVVKREKHVGEEAPPLAEMVELVARLGGWIKRSPKQHSPPGVQTLWQGLHRLRDLATGWSMRGP